MCSTQWLTPVMPGSSLTDPTWYQTQQLTVGLFESGASITSNLFRSRNRCTGPGYPATRDRATRAGS